MPLPGQIVVRLIVWEGELPLDQLRQHIRHCSPTLKDSINYVLRESQWRYQMFKAWSTGDQHKLEIRVQHPQTPENDRHIEVNRLCKALLATDLASNLRALDPSISYTFCPSREGTVTPCDNIFMQYFCKTIVECFCIGDNQQSRKLEDRTADFLFRNNTKYIHQPMVGIYNAADIAERYKRELDMIISNIDMINNGVAKREKLKKEAGKKVVHILHTMTGKKISEQEPHPSKTVEQNAVALSWRLAIACQCIRAFVAFAPEIKKELGPLVAKLNGAVTDGRLLLAKEAYLNASIAPIAALRHLETHDSPSNEDLAMAVNAFGILMQSTMPLFEETLVITDLELSQIVGLSTVAGVGLCAVGGGGIWYGSLAAGASVGGPIGMMAAGGAVAVGFGVAAIFEGIRWGKEQSTNPSTVLLSIQKSLEECSLFILGLILMAAERDGDNSYQEMVAHLRDQLQNDHYTTPGYMKAYYKNVSLKLAADMEELSKGLARYQVTPASS